MKRLLPFLLLFICSTALAESGYYRVEVIVLRNLSVEAESMLADELRSFSQFPDLQESRSPAPPPATSTDQDTGDVPDRVHLDFPDDFQVVTEKGLYMDDVWRRLRSSKNYRPLVYSAWLQNRTDYYPPVRIHDQQLIDTQMRPPTRILVADLTAEDPLANYRSQFYQLDGSVQLRRSRFLHLFLDLEIRVERPAEVEVPGILTPGDFQSISSDADEAGADRGIHSLKQNRQIRTGQLQYFDTPYFGALVLVTAVAPE